MTRFRFLEGPRKCIAHRFALTVCSILENSNLIRKISSKKAIKIIIITLYRNYTFIAKDNGRLPKPRPHQTMTPLEGIYVVPVRR